MTAFCAAVPEITQPPPQVLLGFQTLSKLKLGFLFSIKLVLISCSELLTVLLNVTKLRETLSSYDEVQYVVAFK